MKKIYVALFVLLVNISAQAQHPIDQFIAKYSHHKADEKVVLRLGRPLLALAIPFLEKDQQRWLHKTRAIHIMALEGVDKMELAPAFEKLSKKLNALHYESLLTVRDGKDNVLILAKTDRYEHIRELILLVNSDDNDAVVIRVKVNFNMNDLEKIQHDVVQNNFR